MFAISPTDRQTIDKINVTTSGKMFIMKVPVEIFTSIHRLNFELKIKKDMENLLQSTYKQQSFEIDKFYIL